MDQIEKDLDGRRLSTYERKRIIWLCDNNIEFTYRVNVTFLSIVIPDDVDYIGYKLRWE